MKVQNESSHQQLIIRWSGSANSNEIDVENYRSGALYVDASFVGTAVTIQSEISYDNTTSWATRRSGAANISVAITAGDLEVLPATVFQGAKKLRIVSGSSETCTGLLLLNT